MGNQQTALTCTDTGVGDLEEVGCLKPMLKPRVARRPSARVMHEQPRAKSIQRECAIALLSSSLGRVHERECEARKQLIPVTSSASSTSTAEVAISAAYWTPQCALHASL